MRRPARCRFPPAPRIKSLTRADRWVYYPHPRLPKASSRNAVGRGGSGGPIGRRGGAPGGAALLRHWRAGTPRKRSRRARWPVKGTPPSPLAPPGAPLPFPRGRGTENREAGEAQAAKLGRRSIGFEGAVSSRFARSRSPQPSAGAGRDGDDPERKIGRRSCGSDRGTGSGAPKSERADDSIRPPQTSRPVSPPKTDRRASARQVPARSVR
jgi:hypothetical protein